MLHVSFTAQVNDKSVQRLLTTVTEHVSKGETELTLLISSPGGYIASGITAFNTLKVLPLKKVFWNIGNIDSIGVMMFLAGDERLALPNSRFLFHDVGWGIQTAPANFSEGQLALTVESLRHDRAAIAELSSRVTGQTAEFISSMMKEGKILDAPSAKKLNYIHDEKELRLPTGVNLITIIDQV